MDRKREVEREKRGRIQGKRGSKKEGSFQSEWMFQVQECMSIVPRLSGQCIRLPICCTTRKSSLSRDWGEAPYSLPHALTVDAGYSNTAGSLSTFYEEYSSDPDSYTHPLNKNELTILDWGHKLATFRSEGESIHTTSQYWFHTQPNANLYPY